MKFRYFCDYCDTFFDGAEAFDDAEADDGIETLTGQTGRGIIIQDVNGSDGYLLSICPECNRALGFGEEDNFVFFQKPVMH
ncbi:hypothetical protein [Phosphitispora sp. TUW77]|uniref:hypothetical protein n=1 Tax=Phosphitispora sp. TUW77 TaxID=3152361 RepID=UPI003AB5DFE5